MSISEVHFRNLFHRMLEPRPKRFHISQGEDKWGIVVTRTAITGAQVWYAAEQGLLTLGITTDEMRRKVTEGAIPPNALPDHSPTGWLQYRWQVPSLDLDQAPQEQPDALVVRDGVLFAFDWLKDIRTDTP